MVLDSATKPAGARKQVNKKSFRSQGGKSKPAEPPIETNDRFAALAPSRTERRDSGNARGSVAERMRQNSGSSPAAGGSVAERMRQSAPAPAADEKDGQASRARDEVFAEIKSVLEARACLQLTDFDYRIRQHLHAMLGQGGQPRLHEALETIKKATAKKTRKDVKNWPAYLGKLLKGNDDDVAWKDREARARARVEKAATEPRLDDSDKDSKKNTPRELSEEDAWAEAMNKDLSDEDQWLNEFAAASPPTPQGLQSSPAKGLLAPVEQPPATPQKEAPSQPPKHPPCLAPMQPPPALPPRQLAPPREAPRDNRHMQSPSQPPMMPPSAPPTLPPAHEAALPPTPSKPPQMQSITTPPTKPPMNLPESDIKRAPPTRQVWPLVPPPTHCPSDQISVQAQKLLQEWQLQQKLQGYPPRMAPPPTSLNFPLEAWAQWLYPPPPQYAAPQCTAR